MLHFVSVVVSNDQIIYFMKKIMQSSEASSNPESIKTDILENRNVHMYRCHLNPRFIWIHTIQFHCIWFLCMGTVFPWLQPHFKYQFFSSRYVSQMCEMLDCFQGKEEEEERQHFIDTTMFCSRDFFYFSLHFTTLIVRKTILFVHIFSFVDEIDLYFFSSRMNSVVMNHCFTSASKCNTRKRKKQRNSNTN